MGSRDASIRSRSAWPLVLRLVVLGGALLFLISLPALADESQTGTSPALYALWVLVIAAVAARIYVVMRRSTASKRRSLFVAIAAIPGFYCVGVLVFLLLALAFSS
jgi:hypothetical protein